MAVMMKTLVTKKIDSQNLAFPTSKNFFFF